jgi:hypothetical protein
VINYGQEAKFAVFSAGMLDFEELMTALQDVLMALPTETGMTG